MFIVLYSLCFAQLDTQSGQLKVGDKAPTFSLPQLDLQYVSLRDYCGEKLRKPWVNKIKHVVVISFFATWCKPCIAEIPHLEKIRSDFEGLPVKFFLIDVGEERDKVAKFATKEGLKFTILLDRYNKISEKYDALSIPRLFVVDKEGIVRKEQTGFSDPKQFEKEMIMLLLELLEKT
jgi:peroxiredoxin